MANETPTIVDMKTALEAQMTIMKDFASFLDSALPGKRILETFTDLKMRHRIPETVYRDPSIVRIG